MLVRPGTPAQEGATAVWAGVEALAHLRQASLGSDQKENPTVLRGEERIRNLDVGILQCCAAQECLLGVAEASYHGSKTTDLGQPALPRWPAAPRTAGQAQLKELENGGAGFCMCRHGKQKDSLRLREVISRCHAAGAYVLCDEVMCGLGRHGHGSLFLSAAWNLRPDAVTFGKSMASGGGCIEHH
eukprot:Skav217070  [mRNA]  locus=scaffold1308:11891:15877:- [translate_table: standard]